MLANDTFYSTAGAKPKVQTQHCHGSSVEGALEPLLEGAQLAAFFALSGREGAENGPVGHGEQWVQKAINHSLLLNKDIR